MLFVIAASGGHARAGELRWTAPEACPDAGTLAAEIERALGEPFAVYAALQVEGVVRSEPGDRYSLALWIWSTPASAASGDAAPKARPRARELQATTCQELVEATAVAVAVAAHGALATPSQPAPESPESVERPPLMASTAPVAESPAESDRAQGFRFGASALLDFGALPSLGIGAELELGWRYRALAVGIAGGVIPSRTMRLQAASDAAFGLLYGDVLACGLLELGPVLGRACGVFELGRITAELRGPSTQGPQHVVWRALGGRVGVSVPFGSVLELTAALGLFAPLTRPEFLVDDRTRVHEPAALTWRALFGLAARL